MIAELLPKIMQTAQARSEYVGAFLPDEARLMLVPVRAEDPWEAFRQLRTVLRRRRRSNALIALYEAAAPLEHQAEVISIASRRRAG